MLRFSRISTTLILLLSGQFLYAQAPKISYGKYKFFLLDSNITTVYPVNTGGPVPAGQYSATSTFAGNGKPSNRDGHLDVAEFNHPSGIVAAKNGNIYIVDEKNGSIRKIDPDGMVSTLAIGFNSPSGITLDNIGNLYVAEPYNHRIYRISPSGKVSSFAGSGKPGDLDHSNGLMARFRYPVSLAADLIGNIYVSDEGNHKIRKISPDGTVSTLAGNGTAGDRDDKEGKLATFNQPAGIAVNSEGNVFVADQLNHKIRIVSPDGSVSTLAGNGFAGSANHPDPIQASFNNPRAIAIGAAGWIYVCDTGNQLIRRISPERQVSTLAGSGASGSTDNREGILSSFYFPAALSENETGLYVADCLNNRIRKISTQGFKISPSLLPSGINFDYSSGAISGKPDLLVPGQTFRITGYNSKGSSTAELTLSSSSQPGNALKFDGIDDQVFVPNNPLLIPDVITVEMWVKIGNGLPNRRFIMQRISVPEYYDESYSLGVSPQGYFELLMSSGTGLVEGQVRIHDKAKPIPNKWYFVAGVFSKKDARLYVDGELRAESKTGFPISPSDNGLFLNFDIQAKMTMDEVRLFNYDRSASLKEDMLQPLSPEEPGLILYYDFNMGIAGGTNRYATLFDKSANEINGEMRNFDPGPGLVSNWVESYAMVVPVLQAPSEISSQGFVLNWTAPRFGSASHYLLDLASDPNFEHIVPGYEGKQVSDTNYQINGLQRGTTYYYRLRAYKASTDEQGGNTTPAEVTTAP